MEDQVGRQREEYERFFMSELRQLLDPDGLVEGWSKDKGYGEMKRGETCIWKGIGVEGIYLDTSTPEHEAIVLLRDLSRPKCLFGWRVPAVEPGVCENDLYVHWTVKDAAETYAMIISVDLEEDLNIMSFPRRGTCSPGAITWFSG